MTNKDDNDFLVTFSDFALICKKAKNKIIITSLVAAVLGLFYCLTRPVMYSAEATFREKALNSSDQGSQSLSSILLSGSNESNNAEAITTMRSSPIMEELVSSLGLQADISPKTPTSGMIANIRENLLVTWADFRHRPRPALTDKIPEIVGKDITFHDEIPMQLEMHFTDQKLFTITDRDGNTLAEGTFGVPVVTQDFTITFVKTSEKPLSDKSYGINLAPLTPLAKSLSRDFVIESDKTDKTMLKLQYRHVNRHHASTMINKLMALYQEHLKTRHKITAQEQIAYLQQRQDEMSTRLKNVMMMHAASLASEASTTGFIGTHAATEFFIAHLKLYKQKLFETDLEIKRIEGALAEDSPYSEFAGEQNDPNVRNLVNQVLNLIQQRDAIDLALRTSSASNPESMQRVFAKQIADLVDIQKSIKEATLLLSSIQNGETTPDAPTLFNNPKLLTKTWYTKLIDSEAAWKGADESQKEITKEDYLTAKNQFTDYLTHLIRLLHVHEKTIQEQLTHQQHSQQEFQGFDLAASKEAYLGYSKQLNELESHQAQIMYVLNQMKQPNFEISSLSSVLHDTVSAAMITKASSLILALKDQNNRSQREQERLKEELDLQKGFLEVHLQQTVELLSLRQDLLKDKIQSLQSATLSLIQQEISLLEKRVHDQLTSRLTNLRQERILLDKQQLELRREISQLPLKKVTETLIDHQIDSNQNMIKEITKLVENKNIMNKLEIIQSAPIDAAITPVKPMAPRLFMYTMLGAFLGCVLSLSFVVLKGVAEGIAATEHNLRLAGMYVAGTISRSYPSGFSEIYLDKDLDTLRRLSTFLNAIEDKSGNNVQGNTLVVIQGKGPDFSKNLANLLSKQALKVLLVPISFDSTPGADEFPGLLQCLEGKAKEPKIMEQDGYSLIASGGISRFSNELISSHYFAELMAKFKTRYDWVIAVSHAKPVSAETEKLLSMFDNAVVTIVDEKLLDLEPCIALAKNPQFNKKIAFVINDPL